MDDEATLLESWGDLTVGDRVRQFGGHGARLDTFVLVELRRSTSPLSGEAEALAVIRDDRDETYVVNARGLCRI